MTLTDFAFWRADRGRVWHIDLFGDGCLCKTDAWLDFAWVPEEHDGQVAPPPGLICKKCRARLTQRMNSIIRQLNRTALVTRWIAGVDLE